MLKLKPIALSLCFASLFVGCASWQPPKQASLTPQPATGVVHGGANADALYQLGLFYQGQLRYDDALETYKKVLLKDPEHAAAHNALGVMYATQGRHALAVEEFQTAIRLSPETGHFHNNLGYAYTLGGFDAEAMESYERAMALDPNNSKIVANLRTANEKAGKTTAVAQPVEKPVATPKPAVAPQPAPNETSPARFEPQIIGNDLGAMRLVEINPNVYEMQAPPAIVGNLSFPVGLPISSASLEDEKPATEVLKATRLEISNGNGISGMARRLAQFFRRDGIATARLTNRKPFDLAVSQIEYREGYRSQARALNSKLPQTVEVVKVDGLRDDINLRLVLGKDLGKHVAVFESKPTLAAKH